MKTSFYFVVWICIYPILESLGYQFVNEHSFMVALIIVAAISLLIKELIPQTIDYEKALKDLPLMEHALNGNVKAILKKISTDYAVAIVSAIYFVATTILSVLSTFVFDQSEWLAIAIFGFLSFTTISFAIKLHKAKSTLLANPTPEQSREIVSNAYNQSYDVYEMERASTSYEDMYPERPEHYTAFRVFSIIVAVVAALLGLWFIVQALLVYILYGTLGAALAAPSLLYGSLATYFGIRDTILTVQYKDILKGK